MSIKSILTAIDRVGGPGSADAVLATLAPVTRKLVDGPILVSTYFPVSVSAEIHVGIRQILGKGSWQVNRLVGAEAARIDFKGVYRAFLRLMDYDATLDRLDRAWRQYNSQGEVRWIERNRDNATFEIIDVNGFNEGQWVSIAGRMEAILLMCGAKSSRVELTRVWPTECRARATWVR